MTTALATRRFVFSFLRLTRAGNLFVMALTQYLTAATLVGRHTIDDWKLFVLALSTVAIAGGGYIINDYYDIKIDLVNKPERVVIGKSITRRYAILFHSLLSVAGFLLGMIVDWRIGVINFACAFLLWWYSNDLKRHPFIGNLVVALLTGIAIQVVDAIYLTGNILIVIYALFAFFMTLIREIIKDMEDLRGDDTFGCKTLPIVWGIRRTKFFIYGLMFVFASSVALLSMRFRELPANYFLIFLFPLLLYLLYRLIRSDTKKDFAWLSDFCKAMLLLGVLSLLFI